MTSMINKGVDIVRIAMELDKGGQYEEALAKYKHGLEYLINGLKYEKSAKRKEVIKRKVTEYIARAEQLKKMLDDSSIEAPAASPTSGTAQRGRKPSGKKGGGKQSKEDKEDEKMAGAISGAIVREKPNIRWDDVAGLETAKAALREAVILPMKFPHLFEGKRQPWRGILLYGPPGTGKSFIAKAVATEVTATFFSISSSDLVSKWQGESERLVKQLFEMAREEAPSIVFIDEIDSLCGARSDNESESSRRIKTEFLVQMQGVGKDSTGVLVLGATNLPMNLDSAVRRRFEKRIEIGLPDKVARTRMLELNLGSTPHTIGKDDLSGFADRLEGFSGSDISVLVRDALMEPVRQLQRATHFRRNAEGKYEACSPGTPGSEPMSLMDIDPESLAVPKVEARHFESSVRHCKPSVGRDDLERIGKFTAEFGQ
eukprot:gnl/Dysnectes_brevis/1166_a1300_4432.p1 GENE.gnl/Dysnectes_brevis/1166_a1300_4432~~gnl/Dysnectes_brevis/1166_a1300_4432.p1  ORF type:complete len:448 (-),score=157.13 gnl/Dysnectes_brevis/1166_a1300_4432:50-1336(-)